MQKDDNFIRQSKPDHKEHSDQRFTLNFKNIVVLLNRKLQFCNVIC